MRLAAAATLSLLVAILQSEQSPKSARDQLAELRTKAADAATAGDQQGRLAADFELQRLLNGSPIVVEALARAYAAAGDSQKAIAALNQFADLGQADDNLLDNSDKRFAALTSLPGYKQVLERFRSNETPQSLGARAITLPDAGLLAEDIDYDLSSRSFLITSVLEHKIIRVALNGSESTGRVSVSDFAASPDGWPMLAIKIDAARHRVWATEVALDGFSAAPKEAWGRSAILCYDLNTAKLLRRIDGPPHTALGDVVLTDDGDPIVSDGVGGGVYRVSNNEIHPIDTTDFISPQTSALLPGGDSIVVPDYVRGLAVVNLRSNHVSWLNGDKTALIGVDGVYFHHQALILTQNGTTPQRVIVVELDSSLRRITGSKVIEQASTDFGDPTHGVVVGDDFYYIANSGWNQLDDHGEVKSGARLTPAYIMRYSLK